MKLIGRLKKFGGNTFRVRKSEKPYRPPEFRAQNLINSETQEIFHLSKFFTPLSETFQARLPTLPGNSFARQSPFNSINSELVVLHC